MMRTLSRTMLIVTLASCSAGAAKDIPASTPAAESASLSLTSGTRVTATIPDSLTSRTNKVGDARRAIVNANVADANGRVLIPAGSTVTLSIAELETGSDRTNSQGKLRLEVTAVTIQDRTYPVSADLETVPHHMQGRGVTGVAAIHQAVRDVVVSPGTPITFTLTQSFTVAAK